MKQERPNDSNLTATGGYDHQTDNKYGGNGYDHADSKSGRYGYDHQADDQYDGNGYDYGDSQCGRYGYDHQADNQYDRYGYDRQTDYQCNGHKCRIGNNQRHHFYGDGSFIYSKYF